MACRGSGRRRDRHRDQRAAERFFRRLLRGQGAEPSRIVTDLTCYSAAMRTTFCNVIHTVERYASFSTFFWYWPGPLTVGGSHQASKRRSEEPSVQTCRHTDCSQCCSQHCNSPGCSAGGRRSERKVHSRCWPGSLGLSAWTCSIFRGQLLQEPS